MKTRLQGGFKERGVSLILTVTVMFVLSVMAVTFVRLATFEQTAASNNVAFLDAQLTALAGIDSAIAIMYEQLQTEGRIIFEQEFDGAGSVIAFPEADPDGDGDVDNEQNLFLASKETGAARKISLEEGTNNGFRFSGTVGRTTKAVANTADLTTSVIGRFEPGGNFYALKIKDNSGKLNVNSHISTTNSAESNTIFRNMLQTLADECDIAGGNITTVLDTIRPLNFNATTFEDRLFNNIQELQQALVDANIPNDAALQNLLSNLCTDSFINLDNSVTPQAKTFGAFRAALHETDDAPSYYREARSAVNVNNASLALLRAIFNNIKATAVFYENNVQTTNDDSLDGVNFETETLLENQPNQRVIDFSLSNRGFAIANELHDRIHDTNDPIVDQGELDRFFDSLKNGSVNTTFFPPNPDANKISNKAWQDACVDALKSNCNPNVIDNFWNPNVQANRRVSRADLFINVTTPNNRAIPTHTTELTFFSQGFVDIQAIGMVTAKQGAVTVATADVQVTLNFLEILENTLQTEFDASVASGTNVISSPAPGNFPSSPGSTIPIDTFAGAVEPKPLPRNASGNLFTSGDVFINQFNPADQGKPAQKATIKLASMAAQGNNILEARMPTAIRGSSEISNLAYDGLVNRRMFYGNNVFGTQYFVIPAFGDSLNNEIRGNPSSGINSGVNIANYKGAIEFWMKLDVDEFDAANPNNSPEVACGIIGANIRSRTRTENKFFRGITTAFPEGVQMFIYKNSLGKLRVSRLYWAHGFNLNGDREGAVFEQDGDVNRKIPRRDAVVDLRDGVGLGLKAHEWHHVRVEWDDTQTNEDNSLVLKIDGNNVSGSTVEKQDDPTLDPEFGVLNERDPQDCFFVNSFARSQREKGGYFHFGTRIDFVGNSTIDDILTFAIGGNINTGNFSVTKYPTNAQFTSTGNESFLPTTKGTVTAVRWTSYPAFEGANAPANTPQVSITQVGGQGTQSFNNAETQNHELFRPQAQIVTQPGVPISYRATFNQNGAANQCATLDSVTLVVLRTYPAIRVFSINN